MFNDNPLLLRWPHTLLANIQSVVFGLFLLAVSVHQAKGQTEVSLQENLKLLQQATTNKEYVKAAQYSFEIAKQYHQSGDVNKAIESLSQSLTNAKKSGDQTLLYAVFQQSGIYNLDAKKYSRALEHFQDALAIARKQNDSSLMREQLVNISLSYGYLERFKKAIEHSEEALSLAIINKDVLPGLPDFRDRRL